MECKIEPMILAHVSAIEDSLANQFDDFWNVTTLKQELQNPNAKVFVALLQNEVVGFASIWKAVDEYHVTNIVVRKDLRQNRIGSQLLETLIEVAKSEHSPLLTLEVNKNNIPAQKLYQKYGFKDVGLRKKYYHNTEDALIMTLYF